jgi:hypothetical protein
MAFCFGCAEFLTETYLSCRYQPTESLRVIGCSQVQAAQDALPRRSLPPTPGLH